MIEQKPFGVLPNGEEVTQFTLTNDAGTSVTIITYGGIITSIKTADRNGKFADIVLGHDNLEEYLKECAFFGALIGRFGNRIAQGKLMLEGEPLQLPQNDGQNHLHGGFEGFDKKNWCAKGFERDGQPGVELLLLSEDGDQGYPGNLTVKVVYLLTQDNELSVDYSAVTDKTTPINLTQHSYFNLAGEGDVLGHELVIHASHITPVNDTLIPTGEFLNVEQTPFDFREGKTIGRDIEADHEQLKFGKGYDHNFVLDKSVAGALELAAKAYEPQSGRVLELYTAEPAVQLYSGNFLDGSLSGKGQVYNHRTGFCLEPQHHPDSPNHDHFPSTLLHPADVYQTKMVYRFGAE